MITPLAHLVVAPVLTAVSLLSGPAPNQGDAVWPLDPQPEVVEGFSRPAVEWGAGHRGVDLRGRPGQAVGASRAGSITFAGRLAGRGVVVVSHGDMRTTYEPVTASGSVGDLVRAGERIGSLEIFGSHCWPATCLHWGLIGDRTYLNPLTLVGAGPVRLLPLFSDLPASRAPDRPGTPWAESVRPGGVPGGRPGVVGRW